MVAVCVGGRGRESLAMNLGMQAMAGDCGAWGWTCALHAIVGAMACIALLCNSIKGRIQSQKSCASRQHQNSTAFLFLSIVVLSSAPTFARARRRRSSLLATDIGSYFVVFNHGPGSSFFLVESSKFKIPSRSSMPPEMEEDLAV